MRKLTNIFLILILFIPFGCLSQNKKLNIYIVDTITIKNPIVFYIPNQSGRFVIDSMFIKNNKLDLKKMIDEDNGFIFDDEFYFFLDDLDLKKYHYPDYGNCEFKDGYKKDIKGIVYQKFKNIPKKFIVGLIRASYYNARATAYGEKQTVFRKYNKSLYYKIVFPLCE